MNINLSFLLKLDILKIIPIYGNINNSFTVLYLDSYSFREVRMSKEEILLVKKAVDGDVVAFETLIKSHEKRIYNICLRTMGDRDLAFDASQEALIKVWKNLQKFKGNSTFSTWVYRIAVNTCLDILRKNKLKTTSSEKLSEMGFDMPDNTTPFDERVVGNDSINSALGSLSEEHKVMLVLRDMQGFHMRIYQRFWIVH